MFAGHDHLIHDLLLTQRMVPSATLEAARKEAEAAKRNLTAVLLESGHLSGAEILRLMGDYLEAGCVENVPSVLGRDLVARVTPDVARGWQVVPVANDGSRLKIAAVDPLRHDLREEVSFALGCEVALVVADPRQVELLLNRYYPVHGDGEHAAHADESARTGDINAMDIHEMAEQGPVVRLVSSILNQAIRDRASDIHFEPFASEFKIRYRIDGALHDIPSPPVALALPMISRLKVLANLNIAERRLPQDGRIKLNQEGRAVDLRLSTLPTQAGESVVLRVLDQSSVLLNLDELGLPLPILAGLHQIIRRPNGMLVVTGPTGSGKTTTLYSCLKQLNEPGAKLLTIEDPVEYEIDGIMQVAVNLGAGLTFARALRTFLRQDPDIVMVGEIRDVETAQIAIQASLTGHLVLTTLHTNDAASAVTRLVDMGIEPYLLASSLEAVLAQRLVRRLCPACKVPELLDLATAKQLGVVTETGGPIYRAVGCPLCHQTGYQGRLGIFEFFPLTDRHRELISAGVALQELRTQTRADGLIPLRVAGIEAMRAGETTAAEILEHT